MQSTFRILKRSCFLLTIFVLFAPPALAKPPNVLLIISDDQAWTDFGFMGHSAIKTPALDKLAAQSAVFPRGYVPSSLCRPSLATLVTGLYPHQHKISGNDPAFGDGKPGWNKRNSPRAKKLREKLIANIDNVPTLPKMLKAKDFLSHQSGKWWEGNYRRGGFTHGMTRGFPKPGGRHGDDGLKIGRNGLKPIFDFIDAAGDKPFFLWYAPFLPHSPHNPPKRLLEKYKTPDVSVHVARYFAMCEWFDETCGQLLEYLDKKGLSDDTLVVFVTDNGWIQNKNSGRYAARSKQSPYEGGIRTPIMLRWTGKIKPARFRALVNSIDIAPTILAACDLEPTKDMQGVNLLDVIAGKAKKRDTIFGEIFAHDVADVDRPSKSLKYRWVIEGNWKLILPADGKNAQLFNLTKDPFEKKNLADKNKDLVGRLTGKLDGWWSPDQ